MTIRKTAPGSQPPLAFPAYASTGARAPRHAPIPLPQGATELAGPRFDASVLYPNHADLTKQCDGEPIGERIIVTGRILDEHGNPVPQALVEVWQCNAAGRYHHERDQHDAPLDPNFKGDGRMLTDEDGRYRFVSVKPGAYPWRNHPNAWRPAHIHFSVFGPSMLSRLITQMYFPGDPLLDHDPILCSLPSDAARSRLVSRFDFDVTQPEFALGYTFDIVLRGEDATPAA